LELKQRSGIDRRHQNVPAVTQQGQALARVHVRSSKGERSGRTLERDVPGHWQARKAPSFLFAHILRRGLCRAYFS
jgi:hypothetical protein